MRQAPERQLETLEARYRESLIVALERCAQGQWGLFGRNDQIIDAMSRREKVQHRQTAVQELLALGTEIDQQRQRLNIAEPFDLHQRLMLIRSNTDPNTAGEPRLAQRWLDEMNSS